MEKEKQNPLVSVIMPCFNDGQFIGEAVESLRKQTYPDIELVIVDDGSDDGVTGEIIQQLPFPKKKLLHTHHIGPAAARNRGIEAACGDLILPLDADDLIEPTYVEKAAEMMRLHPEAGIVYCHADLFGEAEGPWELPDYNLRSELLDNVIFVTAMFRKADWKAVGGFCEDFRAGMEDYDFWLSLLGMGREVFQLPEVLFHYRIKPASRTTRFQHSYADVQDTYVKLYQRHREFFRANMDEYCLELRRNLIDQLMINKQLRTEIAEKEQTAETALRDEGQEKKHQQELMLAAATGDPLVEYILSVRRLKPGLGRFFERLLGLKNGMKKAIGRK